MSNVLSKIISHKKQEVSERKKKTPIEILQLGLQNSSRSLYDEIYRKSINHNQPAYILECKKASPSKGLINSDFDIEKIVSTYNNYASGISVLTDKTFFQGCFDYLNHAKQSTHLPILCKDFFIDTYQVYEARYYGADAILLMLSVLDDEDYIKLAQLASNLDLDVLTEVHDKSELERAIKLDAKIIGINNRNLKDLSISLNTTKDLANRLLSNTLSHQKRLIISESGITSNNDIIELSSLVDGFLVGSHLMSSINLDLACKKLIYGNIKICGLTNIEDANNATSLGASYGGFIFYKQSKRFIEVEQAKEIAQNFELLFVGVFVNEDVRKIIEIVHTLQLYAIQLHGNENNDDINYLKTKLPNTQIWKAMPVNEKSTAKSLANQINLSSADIILLDTQNNSFGGTGVRFNWALLQSLDKLLDEHRSLQNDIILAGGLSAENIIEAKSYACHGLDVNSGIEISPGIKSLEKLDILFKNIARRN